MILRKPYAFFIKYFKVFHIILSLMMAFLVYKTHQIFLFYNDYIASSQLLNITNITKDLYSTMITILPLLIIAFSILILIVLYTKKKKYIFYVFMIIMYALIFTLILYSKGTTLQIEEGAIDLRILKAIKDFYFIGYIGQLLLIAVTVVRAIGFDIKKFDFISDLKDLNITEEDREEFEVSISFDTNKTKRNWNRKLRNFKYFYKEKKLLINSIVIIGFVVTGFFIFLNIRENINYIAEKETFSVQGLSYQVKESYIVDKDYKGNIIDKDNFLVVVNVHIKNNLDKEKMLKSFYYELLVNENVYYHTSLYNEKVFDLGKGYKEDSIKDEGEYAFIYEVPKDKVNEDFTFRVFNSISANNKKEYLKVKLKPIKYDKESKDSVVDKKEVLSRGIFKDLSFNIKKIEIQKEFKLNYNFCVDEECFESTEIIKANINSNYDKALIKVNGTFDNYDISYLLYNFGQIKYVVNNNEVVKKLNLGIIKPTKINIKDTYFLEIPVDVLTSSSVILEINVRNQLFKYTIK